MSLKLGHENAFRGSKVPPGQAHYFFGLDLLRLRNISAALPTPAPTMATQGVSLAMAAMSEARTPLGGGGEEDGRDMVLIRPQSTTGTNKMAPASA